MQIGEVLGPLGVEHHVGQRVPGLRGTGDGEFRHEVIDQIVDELKGYRLADVQARNETFFQEEAEKLERRSEDLKVGLEREIKKLDKEIATLRREGRQSRGLEEQLAMQKRLRVLEDRRKEKRRQYYDEQDHIDADQKAFIEQMEAQLRDKRVDLQDLFTIRWTLR